MTMIGDGNNVVEILGQLSTTSDHERTKIIESVRPILGSLEGRAKYKIPIENSDLAIVFDCLNASGKDEILAATELLGQILSFIDPSLVLNRYIACLNRCLHHPNAEVKAMVIRFLRRCLEVERCLEEIFKSENILFDVTKLIADDNSTVAKEVKQFFYEMAMLNGSERVNSMPFVQPILPVLQELLNQEKEVNRLRIEELMIMIAKISPEMTERVASAGIIQRLCREVLTDDVLVQLNAIEILSDFAESQHGLLYLEKQGALKDMDSLLCQSSSSPMARFLLPGFIKFFGRVSRNHPENFAEKYPNFTNTVFSLIKDDSNINEPGLKNLAIATIGHISTNLNGKQKIASIDGFLNGKENGIIVKTLVNLLRYGTTDDKIVALNTCRDILSMEGNEPVQISSEIGKSFYEGLIQSGMKNPIEYMFQIIKQPFGELAESAYCAMQNIGKSPWAVHLFVGEPGLLEYILDRDVHMKKEGKEMKYELIRILQLNSVSSDGNVMPPEMLMRLKKYVKDGPFHVEAISEVALGEC